MNNQERIVDAVGRFTLSLYILGLQMGLLSSQMQMFGEAVEELQKAQGGNR